MSSILRPMVVAAVALSCVGADTAHSQKSAIPPLKAPVACALVAEGPLLAQIEGLYRQFESKWLHIGEHWFQAYQLPGEQRNPLMPRAERAGAVRGIAWVKNPSCLAALEPATGDWTMRIVAQRLTFSEAGGPWSRPLPSGVLAEFVLRRSESSWTVQDRTEAVSFRQPEDKEWRPTVADLPERIAAKAVRIQARP